MKRFWLAAAAAAGMATGATAADPAMAPVVPLNGAVSSAPTTGAVVSGTEASYPVDPATQRFGLMPMLRKAVWWKPNYGACDSCEGPTARKLFGHKGLGHGGHAGHGGLGGHGGPGGGGGYGAPGAGVPGYPQPGQPGMGMPGTLAFPHHPFARSPRDFFMYDSNK